MMPTLSAAAFDALLAAPRPAPVAFAVWRRAGRGWRRVGVCHTRRAAEALARSCTTLAVVLPLVDPRWAAVFTPEGDRP